MANILSSYGSACKKGVNNLRSTMFCRSVFSPQTPTPPANHVPALDGIRALALIWVLSFHTQYFLGSFYSTETAHAMVGKCASSLLCRPLVNGHFAVDVFFVLSGYLVAHNLHLPHFKSIRVWDTRTGRTKCLVVFWIRRMFRILPCYYFTFCL